MSTREQTFAAGVDRFAALVGDTRSRVEGLELLAGKAPAGDLAKLLAAQRNGWYAFRSYRTATMQINGAATPEQFWVFDSEEYDYASRYNPATGIYSVPVDGVYDVSSAIHFRANNTTEYLELCARVGTTWRAQEGHLWRGMAGNDQMDALLSTDLRLTAGDQLRMSTGHYIGGNNLAVDVGASQRNYFAVHLVYPI